MSEAPEATQPAEVNVENPRSEERRGLEAESVFKAALMTEHRKRLIGPDGTLTAPQSSEDHAIRIVHAILTGQNKGETPFTMKFPKATGSGHDIMMPEIKQPDRGGTVREFANGELRLAGINGVTPDGQLLCYFEDSKGTVVEDSAGADEAGSNMFQLPLSREQVAALQIRSEMGIYAGFFPGETQQVFQAVMGDHPMDEEMDGAIEQTAKAAGMVTAEDVTALIDKLSPDKATRSADVTKLLDSLKGKIVLTKTDFQEAIKVVGGSTEALSKRASEISARIAELQKITAVDQSNTVAAKELENLQAEQAVIGTAHAMFSEAEKTGGTPFDEYFDKAQNGELDPAFVEAFREGDFNKMADFILTQQNVDPQDTQKRNAVIEVLKWSPLAVPGIPLGLAALLALMAGAAVVAGVQAIATGGGRR